MKALTKKEFNSKLSGVVRSVAKQRDNIQELIEAGLVEVQESGNTIYLSMVLSACVGVKALPTKAMKEYIQAHCTNLKYKKNKDGNMVFVKAEKGKEFVVTEPSVKWYEHASAQAAQAKPDLDVVARAKALLTSIEKASSEGKVKDAEEAQRVAKALKDALKVA